MKTVRHAKRGITRFELMTGGAILALVVAAGTWWVGSADQDSAMESAKETANELLHAASDWKREHEQTGCPSVTQLVRDKALPRTAAKDDPWGGRYRIICRDDSVQVRSAGVDRRFKTADDIELATPWRS